MQKDRKPQQSCFKKRKVIAYKFAHRSEKRVLLFGVPNQLLRIMTEENVYRRTGTKEEQKQVLVNRWQLEQKHLNFFLNNFKDFMCVNVCIIYTYIYTYMYTYLYTHMTVCACASVYTMCMPGAVETRRRCQTPLKLQRRGCDCHVGAGDHTGPSARAVCSPLLSRVSSPQTCLGWGHSLQPWVSNVDHVDQVGPEFTEIRLSLPLPPGLGLKCAPPLPVHYLTFSIVTSAQHGYILSQPQEYRLSYCIPCEGMMPIFLCKNN